MVANRNSPNNENNDATRDTEQDDAVIGRAFLGSIAVFVLIGLVGLGSYLYLSPKQNEEKIVQEPIVGPEMREMPSVRAPEIKWNDITQSAGIEFTHVSGATGEKLLPETMGSGCAFFDFDSDGDSDILLINCCHWDPAKVASDPTPMKLFQNDGKGNYKDFTKEAGLDVTVYGMGVACGDYDNDGKVDLFISCLGSDRLFHNEGGRFVDVTQSAGVGGDPTAWSVASGWFDYDRDNDLDLLVCHYILWSREFDLSQKFVLVGGKERGYGRPQPFGGTFPSLFRNDGQGRFTDVSKEAGLQVVNPTETHAPLAKSLGLVFEDFDDDGYLDFVIANDTVQNLLFHNNKDGTFEEIGAAAGVAFDAAGAARGAMGIDAAAFRNNASVGIAIGNFANEMSALYVSRTRNMQFFDAAVANGLGPATRLELTFAVMFLDYDLDTRLDLFQANGHLESDIARVQASQKYEQPPQLFWNAGLEFTTEFLKCTVKETGPDFQVPMVGRGASYADIDGDGDLDLLITGCGQKPRLLRNDQQTNHHWLRLKLVGSKCNRDAIGASVIVTSGDVSQRRLVSPTRSYLSQVELPVTFGLGTTDKVELVTILWPDGTTQKLQNVSADQLLVVQQESK
jgi:enediyne biosynthesis protein E4